jgi:hypothetical protein
VSGVVWVRSSRCESSSCVELARSPCGVQVRDGKDPDGPVLSFTREAWREFTNGVRGGEFDLP